MLFKPALCQAILDGTKTQTRRLVQYGDGKLNLGDGLWFMQGVGSNFGSMVQRGANRTPTVVIRQKYAPYRVKWQVGRTYAIQPGRGKEAIGRFKLLAIRREWLLDISEEDCIAEGVFRVPESPDWWEYPGSECWFVSSREANSALWDSINTKKGARWQDNPEAWALELEVVKGENDDRPK